MSPDPHIFRAPRSGEQAARDIELGLQAEAWDREQSRIRADEDAHQADRRRIGALFGRPAGTLRRLDHAERADIRRAQQHPELLPWCPPPPWMQHVDPGTVSR